MATGLPVDIGAALSRRALLLALTGLISGCASLPPPAAINDPSLFVIARGWHTDIAFANAHMPPPLAAIAADFPGARYLVFGFGDRAYYLSRDEGPVQTIAALFPGPGIILVTGLSAAPDIAFGADQIVPLALSPAQAARAASFVRQSLQPQSGTPRREGEGPYQGSVFYASGRTYDVFDNCNNWTARALAAAGLPVTPSAVLLTSQVMAQARAIVTRN